jgi:2-polyprenyl-3-methyl-5-hydroxy-6-metoxy-1,4-benzoquinol methylase
MLMHYLIQIMIANKTDFSENDIRPKDLLEGQKIAVKQDIGRLLSHADKFTHVNCPACESPKAKKKYSKNSFTFLECEGCKTVYTNPRPTADLLGKFYSSSVNYAYWNKYIFPASEQTRRQKIVVPRVEKILEYCKKYQSTTSSLLEVGAGFGTFCEELASRKVFKRIVAVEPSPTLAETCRKRGVETIELPIEKVNLSEEEKFDVVVNFEVIEHLFSPKDFLLQCKRQMKPGALFVVSCPNGQGFDVITLKEKSNTIDHEHLNYFNPHSIELLFKSNGFDVLEILTPGVLDADIVRNTILEGEFHVDDQPFLKAILIDEWETKGKVFQEFLTQNNLSSNLWIIAKNK